MPTREGWHGWNAYAAFYDWENARTVGRRDLPFWRTLVGRERPPVLELGCGTGRLLIPLAKTGVATVGIDRSEAMLTYARGRARRLASALRPVVVRGDVRRLPFAASSFGVVMAPYGLLQSLLRDRDLDAALAEAGRVLRPGGLLGVDLVPDLPRWAEYGPRVRLRGRTRDGGSVTLVEAVRQDRRRGLTVFDEHFTARRHGRETSQRFSLTFRTLTMPRTVTRIERVGLHVERLLGDYRRAVWHARADVWVILARKG
jgi:SAM-dependent methyltransferase